MTVWYDFTTTIRNRGRSGIANVEWSVGQALLQLDDDVRCFELAPRHGLVALDPVSRLATAVYASPGAEPARAISAIPTWRDRVRAALRVRFGVRADSAIRMMSAVYRLPASVRRIRPSGWRIRRGDPPARLVDLIRPDDVVVSMGADWEGELAGQLLELKRRTGCTVVTMVYDLVPLTHTHLAFHNDPQLFDRYYRGLVDVSDLITCISEQTRRDLHEFARARGLTVPRTAVLVLGEAPPSADVPRRADFFLCVGTIERRKNIELIYDALRILDSEGRELPRVVVAGAPGWGTDDLLHEIRLQSTPASRAMVLLGSVDDPTLDRLYGAAAALLFPSYFEGWGLPVREAAVRGCPTAVGDSPAVREAAAGFGGATILPTDDPGPWADFMRDGPHPAEPTNIRPWSAVASELLELLRDLDSAAAPPTGLDSKSSR
jgi:glycosyltransferase involved in cell wall biosynthesis